MTRSLSRLHTFYGHLDGKALLNDMINVEFKGRIALVSSFGAGSAALLELVAEVNPNTTVLFLETKKHFPETLEYVETLRDILKLTDLRLLYPDAKLEKQMDPDGNLWQSHPTKCCWFRKVEPLQRELNKGEFEALITGRKRYQTKERQEMQAIELHEDGRFRINPLAFWDKDKVTSWIKSSKLPEHPLVSKGYPSIGCAPCTLPVKEGEDERAGRWAHTAEMPGGEQKTECGIHVPGMIGEAASPAKPDWNI